MIPLKITVNDEIVGWVMEQAGDIKFVSINPHVKAALFLAKDHMFDSMDDKEPSWEDLTNTEEEELKKLDEIENIAFLARQAF